MRTHFYVYDLIMRYYRKSKRNYFENSLFEKNVIIIIL